MSGVRVVGLGASLPEKIVTNAAFAARLDTTDAWIAERTGILERRMGGTTSSLATGAGAAALASSGIDPADIDLLVLATSSPDQLMPATACTVQQALGTSGGAFDVNAACTGFVYAMVTAAGIMAIGARRALVIGSDVLSTMTDQDDRNTAVLFGDGAGAVILETVDDGPGNLLAWDLAADGSTRHLLYIDHGKYLQMDGKEVFRRAVRVFVDSAHKTLQDAGLTPDDVALLVPHQANSRIIGAACDRLGIPLERTAVNLDRVGNTSAGSIPLALADAVAEGRLHDGDIVLMVGFGAGMTWASVALKWGP